MAHWLSHFCCPSCGSESLEKAEDCIRCDNCNSTFPCSQDIPILVKDPEHHESEIKEARSVNPLWYVDEQPPEEASPWRHHLKKRRNYVENVLRRALAAQGKEKFNRLLDLGCGDGNNLSWLAQYAEQSFGSDYNMVRLTRAKAKVQSAHVFLADLLDYPAKDNTFDIIFFNHVLEHIQEDTDALKQVHRILAPDGLLVLGTPNEGAWWWQLAYRRDPESLAQSDHVQFYTSDTLSARVKDTGFSISEVHHMGWGPPDWRLDGIWRQHKFVDDAFEWVGKAFLRKQASSLYVIAGK